ncbi:MAG: D-aminoacyl-tRNA deacylase [Bacteroidota bacterium]|nr:D-aminoacyl-tRNA deacylase [Bacteroidota bacterium]
MRAVIQRVSYAEILVDKELISKIDAGLLIFLGIEINDNYDDIKWLANKIVHLRLFADNDGVMNKSVMDIEGEILVVSQFTLHAKTKKGARPSYIRAAKSKEAQPVYEDFCKEIEQLLNNKVYKGRFGANMQVISNNDGPVTIIIDTKNKE